MGELNYLRIAQLLGGRLTKTQAPTFGAFGAARTSAERFRLIREPASRQTLGREALEFFAEAFEETREGYEPDRVLVDPTLSRRFLAEVRRRGVRAPAMLINKRLQALRKYPAYGIRLKRTTRAAGLEPEPFFYAAELGFVQLSYRREVSVDDVVTDPDVGQEFVTLCKDLAPHGNGMVFKWAALRLRKMRSFTPKRMSKLLAFDAGDIEDHLELVTTLDRFSPADAPDEKGIYAFAERNGEDKYLYVGASDSIREAVKPFEDAEPFRVVAGQFWRPSLGQITLRAAVVKKPLRGASARDLSLRLIEERRPLFNMPVHIESERRDAA